MKVILTSVSGRIEDKIIEINTIEELFKLSEELKEELIITTTFVCSDNNDTYIKKPCIEVYDDYREEERGW